MNALAFDTLLYSKRLQSAGVNASQADAHAEALAHALGSATQGLMTHADSERLEASLKQEIHGLAQRMGAVEGELRLLEQRMTIKLGSLLVVAVGVFAALSKLL